MDTSQDAIQDLLDLLSPPGTSAFTRTRGECARERRLHSFHEEDDVRNPRSESHPEDIQARQKDATTRATAHGNLNLPGPPKDTCTRRNMPGSFPQLCCRLNLTERM